MPLLVFQEREGSNYLADLYLRTILAKCCTEPLSAQTLYLFVHFPGRRDIRLYRL